MATVPADMDLRKGNTAWIGGLGCGASAERAVQCHWRRQPIGGDLPPPLYSHTASLLGSSVVLYGGRFSLGCGECNPDVETWTWERLTDAEHRLQECPPPRYRHAAGQFDSSVLAVNGGWSDEAGGGSLLGDTWLFDLRSREWTKQMQGGEVAPAPPSRYRHAGCGVRNGFLIFGGNGDGGLLADTWLLSSSTGQWEEVPCSDGHPSARSVRTIARMGRKLYLSGGFNGTGSDGEIWELDTESQPMSWRKLDVAEPEGVSGHATVGFGSSRVLVSFGGIRGGRLYTNESSVISILGPMERLAEWLHGLNLLNEDEYLRVFMENEVTLDVLCEMSEEDLEKMGISAMGARKRIIQSLRIRQETTDSLGSLTSAKSSQPHVPNSAVTIRLRVERGPHLAHDVTATGSTTIQLVMDINRQLGLPEHTSYVLVPPDSTDWAEFLVFDPCSSSLPSLWALVEGSTLRLRSCTISAVESSDNGELCSLQRIESTDGGKKRHLKEYEIQERWAMERRLNREQVSRFKRFTPGEVLRDRYVLKRYLGGGGYGEVFLVTDRRDGCQRVIKLLSAVPEGGEGSEQWRLWLEDSASKRRVSSWHDLPILAGSGGWEGEGGSLWVWYVNEIPLGGRAKTEMAKKERGNPMKQDIKKGRLRFFRYGDLPFNYGALPQTWEDPNEELEATKTKGDNDPLDAVEIGTGPLPRGAVVPARVLGSLALIDQGETDWKILLLRSGDPLEQALKGVPSLEAALPLLIHGVRDWFRMYKTPDGDSPNCFAFDGRLLGSQCTAGVIRDSHKQWARLASGEIANAWGHALPLP